LLHQTASTHDDVTQMTVFLDSHYRPVIFSLKFLAALIIARTPALATGGSDGHESMIWASSGVKEAQERVDFLGTNVGTLAGS
jgi:hypothetical protein